MMNGGEFCAERIFSKIQAAAAPGQDQVSGHRTRITYPFHLKARQPTGHRTKQRFTGIKLIVTFRNNNNSRWICGQVYCKVYKVKCSLLVIYSLLL